MASNGCSNDEGHGSWIDQYTDEFYNHCQEKYDAERYDAECGESARAAELAAQMEANKQIRDRNVTSAIADKEAKSAAYQAARNQGLTAGEAQAIAGQSEASTQGNATNIGAALRSTGQSTQNDYLQKMGYSKGLEQQAGNIKAGAMLNTLGAIFGGAGSGASVGASIGGGA